ncbi:MAG: hypothetical protein HY805_05680 [Nitrospirae bacterium]|nr:hypothetical protein [Nitrospirota bacterium]
MTKRKKEGITRDAGGELFTTLPGPAHSISAIGPKAEAVILDFYQSHIDSPLFKVDHQDSLTKLAKAFGEQWNDEEATIVIKKYLEAVEKAEKIDITALSQWVLAHPNDARAVLNCMSIEPPQGFDIIRVLSKAGSQKLVFLATWHIEQKQVVLKKPIGSPEFIEV